MSPEFIKGLFALAGGIVVGVTAIIVALINHGSIARRLGKPNGRGTVTEMAEQTISMTEQQTEMLEGLKDQISAYREDSNKAIGLIRNSIGGLTVDMGGMRELTDRLRLIRTDVNVLQDQQADLRTRVAELSTKLNDIEHIYVSGVPDYRRLPPPPPSE